MQKNIHINLAKSAGFCFGVKRAINIALKTASSEKKVVMLGNIVHNEEVVRQINAAGIKTIDSLTAQKDKTLLIRAHGAPLSDYLEAKRLGFKITDATCPMVKEIHKIVREMEEKGYAIIVIGDRNHDEVRGIMGQLKQEAILVDPTEKIPLRQIKNIKKACVVAQSTQNLEFVSRIVELLKKHIAELEFFNTVCMPTRTKQEEIRKMPLENDVMVIIGSRTSANTKRLYEISKSLNKRTYLASSKDEIKKNWFKAANSVGVTAGASTPDSTTQKIIEHIKKLV